MTIKFTLIFFAMAIFTLGLYFVRAKTNSNKFSTKSSQQPIKLNLEAKQIVDSLQKLGYFKYTEADNIDNLKKEIISGLEEYYYLSTIYEDNKPYNSKDFRHYHLDGEDLFELGGFIDELKEMTLTFDKMNIKLVVNENLEEWDEKNNWLNHRITINNKQYIVFRNFRGYGWGEAAQRFADILNDQFQILGTDERIYLANGGNDGRAVFLTEDQFKLLDPYLKNDNDRPLRIEDWCKVMQIERQNIN